MTPSLFAGTYTVESVEWYPTGSNVGLYGGTIGFSGLDISYSLSSSIIAPNAISFNTYAVPSVVGQWRWKVRWVGAVGEAAPLTVSATVYSKGTGSTSAYGMSSTAGRLGSGSVDVLDPNLTAWGSSQSNTGPVGPVFADQDSAPYTTKTAFGGVTFSHVSGTTYEGYVNYSVQSQAMLAAHGENDTSGDLPVSHSVGAASVNLSVKMRLTHIAGVRVQSDLP